MPLQGVSSVEDGGAPKRADLQDLYVACYPRLVGQLTLMAGNHGDAEEALQEAFARLVPRWGKISQYDDPEAWVRRVAVNLLSHSKTRHFRGMSLLPHVEARPTGTEDVRISDETGVIAKMRSLPVGQRQVVVLHYLLDMPIEDVAGELGIPTGTVKSRLFRARATLGSYLKEVADHD